MAKLYAELTSDKGGRVASKGGDNVIKGHYSNGNVKQFVTVYEPGMLSVFTLDKKGNSVAIKIIHTA